MNFMFLAFAWSEMSKGDLSLLTTMTGIIIVFSILIILTLVISLFGKIGSASGTKGDKTANKTAESGPKPPVKTAPPVSKSIQTAEDDSLIAVIAAAVHAFGESVGQKLAIKSVQRAPRKSKDGRSAWATAGVRDNTRSF